MGNQALPNRRRLRGPGGLAAIPCPAGLMLSRMGGPIRWLRPWRPPRGEPGAWVLLTGPPAGLAAARAVRCGWAIPPAAPWPESPAKPRRRSGSGGCGWRVRRGERYCGSELGSKHRRRASGVRLVGQFRRLPAGRDVTEIPAGTIGRRSADRSGRKKRCRRLFAGVNSSSGIEFVLPDGVHLGKIG